MSQFLQTILEGLGYIFAAIGFAASVFKAYKAWRSIHRLTWNDTDKQTKKLIKKIVADNYHPDIIVTIGRGGAIIGSILSGNLPSPNDKKSRNIPILGVDRLYKWEDGHRVEIENNLVKFSPLKGQKVLLVAGDLITGGTMHFFSKKIENVGVADLKCACLLKGITSTFRPDYFGKEIPAEFETPWMYKGYGYSKDSRLPADYVKPTWREKWRNRIS